jgi:hypothetical protein
MSPLKYRVKSTLFRIPCTVADTIVNATLCKSVPRVLVVRHPGKRSYTYRDFLQWVSHNVPELRDRMEFRHLPLRSCDWNKIGLVAGWTADTLDTWSPTGYRQAIALTESARSRGIPVVNAIHSMTQATKAASTEAWRSAGLLAPRCQLITDARAFSESPDGFEYPFLVRDARGHGRPSFMVRSRDELKLVEWHRLLHPMACEFIETRSSLDGLYRKYRCIVAGGHAIPRHMIANHDWEVRPENRVVNTDLVEEELEFVRSEPDYQAQLVFACQMLDLDIAGIDYSFDATGRLVLWEANPVPNLNIPPNHRAGHLLPAVHRSFAAIAMLYLSKLKVDIPEAVHRELNSSAQGEPRGYLSNRTGDLHWNR